LLLGTVLAAWSAAAAAGDLVVICNSSVSLKADEVRDVYFGDKAFAGTVKLAPADNSASQAAFLDKVMKLDAKKYSGVWIKKAFRDGSAPPPVKASDAEAIAYVKQTPGGCSYVTSAPGDGVAVVGKF
jgi:hypothetical protein